MSAEHRIVVKLRRTLRPQRTSIALRARLEQGWLWSIADIPSIGCPAIAQIGGIMRQDRNTQSRIHAHERKNMVGVFCVKVEMSASEPARPIVSKPTYLSAQLRESAPYLRDAGWRQAADLLLAAADEIETLRRDLEGVQAQGRAQARRASPRETTASQV